MIIPIFIPHYVDNDDCENKHGYGCKCPDCLEKEKFNNIPREYYKYRYAVPSYFVLKNILFKVLCWFIAIIGLSVMILSIFLIDIKYTWIILLDFIVGGAICVFAYILGNRIIKYDFECSNKIYIEIKDSFFYPETWEEKIKTMNIPKGYILTKEKSDWRYKSCK